MFVPRQGPTYTEEQAREAIAASLSFAETLRRLGKCPTGGAAQVLRKWTVRWGIPTDHFDPYAASRGRFVKTCIPLDEILVEGSTYNRGQLKVRLFDAGLKDRRCELCGLGEIWHGRRFSLILDHINGVSNDNRIENLRVVCPNCAATLDTHCGRKLRLAELECALCGTPFQPKYSGHRYCSPWCGQRHDRSGQRGPRPKSRKVERPPYEQLVIEVDTMGYCTVGRKYGVSDNAIRKWLRAYEWELWRVA
jgi:Zn finger protein HypA/HybF involved in hydrogenase expression